MFATGALTPGKPPPVGEHLMQTSKRRRPSCLDQFDRPSEPQPERDDWIESLIARLRALIIHRIGGKK